MAEGLIVDVPAGWSGVMALPETVSGAHGADWLGVLTREWGSGPGAVDRAHEVYALLDELAGSAADDPRGVVRAAEFDVGRALRLGLDPMTTLGGQRGARG